MTEYMIVDIIMIVRVMLMMKRNMSDVFCFALIEIASWWAFSFLDVLFVFFFM